MLSIAFVIVVDVVVVVPHSLLRSTSLLVLVVLLQLVFTADDVVEYRKSTIHSMVSCVSAVSIATEEQYFSVI